MKIYKFKDALGTGIPKWDRCVQYHEEGSDFYVEVIMIGSVYVVREQRGEQVVFNFYYYPEAAIEHIDLIM